MNSVAVTAIAALIAALTAGLGSVVLPVVRDWFKARQTSDTTKVVSWQSITAVLQKERDDLRQRLDGIDAEYKARLRAMEADYDARLAADRGRINSLEREVSELYGRLYRTPLPPDPYPR